MTPATETVTLQGDGVRLVADVRGPADGRPVLLLHGGGQTRHSWRSAAAALAGAGWSAVAVDARGHGDSEWSPDGDYTFERYAADVRVLVEQFPGAALVGASLGGVTSLLALGVTATPVAASALVMVDVAHRLDPRGRARIHAFMQGHDDGFASLEEAAAAVAAYQPTRRRPPNPEGLRKNLRLRDDGRWHWHWDRRFSDGTRVIPTEALVAAAGVVAARGLPTLVVRGRLSEVMLEEHARELLDLIPQARLVDVGGAGHMVAGDSNDAFTAAILDFLGRARDAGAARWPDEAADLGRVGNLPPPTRGEA